MIIVLSGFNGIEGLVANLYSKHHPDLIITPKNGKTLSQETRKIKKKINFFLNEIPLKITQKS